MNSAHIIGNLTGDPELRHTHSGKAVCDITVAVSDNHGAEPTTAFIGVVVWGVQAENLAKYKRKGDPLAVSGRLTQEHWDDKETGRKRERTKITAERVDWLHRAPARDSRPDHAS